MVLVFVCLFVLSRFFKVVFQAEETDPLVRPALCTGVTFIWRVSLTGCQPIQSPWPLLPPVLEAGFLTQEVVSFFLVPCHSAAQGI